MMTKKYQLTEEAKASHYVQGGVFKFRVSYEKIKGSRKTIFGQKNSPVIEMSPEDILSTENETAQDRLVKFTLPNRTYRNGVNQNPEGVHLFFKDVTDSEKEATLDLDTEYFNG